MSDAPATRPHSARRQPNPLPEDKRVELRSACGLEWTTLALRITVVIALYAVIGHSQALAAIWLKSLWALLPPIAFLAAVHIESRPPTARFPFGFYRAGSIGFLTAALALTAMGGYLVIAGAHSLIAGTKPGLMTFAAAGGPLQWPGWWLVAALAYSVAVPFVLGRRRSAHAIALHDKGLYADASMGHMNWVAGVIAILGVLGLGLGIWWVDFMATVIIGVHITSQGLRHLRTAVCDLMDEIPRRIGSSEVDPLGARIRAHLADEAWVADVHVRLREEGRLLTGIALICPNENQATLADFESARATIVAMDWRLLDFQLVPVARLDFASSLPAA
ncbi:cation transporter [Salinisphaera sp. Q1T1-3]|uniref:cation transporter n=1 Tax=Salinisphaera sp. Q1T1-3 TaxID=2321229 RepID=UPI0013140440|nr:cation transporter [Salinisphaera sp. Q1T1-3]